MVNKTPIPNDITERILGEGAVSIGRKVSTDGKKICVIGVKNEKAKEQILKNVPLDRVDNDCIISFEIRSDPQPVVQLSERKTRFRPIPMGVSAGHFDISAGTTSWLLTDGSKIYGSSNRHVYAPLGKGASVGDPILQPGPVDGGTELNDVIGHLAGYVEPVNGYEADLAWIEPIQDKDYINEMLESGIPKEDFQVLEPDDLVYKEGRTTGVTSGKVLETNITYNNVGGARLDNQMRISAFAQGGDSGSPVYTLGPNNERLPAGILWAIHAGEDGWKSTVVSPAESIVSESGMQILTFSPEEPVEEPTGPFGLSREAIVTATVGAGIVLMSRKSE